jgi:hypothetical protein
MVISDRDHQLRTKQFPSEILALAPAAQTARSALTALVGGTPAPLDLTDNERAILITALRRLVDFDPQALSPQIQALKAILERLEPQKPQLIPDTASTG